MRVVLLEDEPPAVAQLTSAIRAWDPTVRIVAVAESVAQAVDVLRARPEPDLVFADIRLSDGLSLHALDQAEVRCPVVFATAYDAYVIEALERNAIDYLLKPIEPARVAQALDKYLRLGEHFSGRMLDLREALATPRPHGPERLLARKGAAFVAVPVTDIAWLTTEHKLTILVDRTGARLALDDALGDLEAKLDPARFFRLNRQYLAQIDAVVSFRGAGKGRILVTLRPSASDDVLISQENATRFRAWIAR